MLYRAGLITTVLKPLMLRTVINAIASGDAATTEDRVVLLVGLGLVFLLEGLFTSWYRHLLTEDTGTTFIQASFKLGIDKIGASSSAAPLVDKGKGAPTPKGTQAKQAKAGCCGGKTGAPADSEETVIDPTSLFGNDVLRRFMDFQQISGIPVGASSIIGGTILLYFLVGWEAATSGLALMCAILKVRKG